MAQRIFRLYDTLTKTVKELFPKEEGCLKMYSCGPTVYSYAHIGNFRTFLTADLIYRVANALDWKVIYVSNITDVGHLTEDTQADAGGEDKMARALCSQEGACFANVWDLSEHYTQAFLKDWKRLNLLEPTVRPKATQHMREQILMIQALLAKNFAYETPDGIYFDVSRFEHYGALSGNKEEDLRQNTRGTVQDPHKKNAFDFALWKKDPSHLMQWHSPWGWGFPGWHLECSAMAQKYLGDTFDLHAGGEDLIFPHHECEIAQSECLNNKKFARHWVHTRFLQVEGEKMSKSKGNFYTVRDLLDEKGISPLALRYALLSVPFSKPLNFTFQSLKDASNAVDRFQECLRMIRESQEKMLAGPDIFKESLVQLYEECLDALCDNLNTSVAIAKAYEVTKILLREGSEMSLASAQTASIMLEKFDALLGIIYLPQDIQDQKKGSSMPDEAYIKSKIAERLEAKRQKQYDQADVIRNELLDQGIELRDTPQGTVWKFRSEFISH